ncbi:MAG: copper resistance protein B [Nitrospira sp.]
MPQPYGICQTEELAPYIGLSLDRSFGQTATLVRQQGGDPSQIRWD